MPLGRPALITHHLRNLEKGESERPINADVPHAEPPIAPKSSLEITLPFHGPFIPDRLYRHQHSPLGGTAIVNAGRNTPRPEEIAPELNPPQSAT